MNIYDLSRNWFDWSFENPELIKPPHSALYFFAIEHCNRLGWKEKFGLPTTMAMEAIGIKSYNTYKATFDDLIKFGFVKLIQKSTNQYSANIIALSNFNKAPDKAHTKARNKPLDEALIKHKQKQRESNIESTDSINKQTNKETIKQTKKKSMPTPEVEKIKYADFVFLKESEYQKLIEKHGTEDTNRMVEKLNNFKASTGKEYKSDYHAIGNWVVDWLKEEKIKESRGAGGAKNSTETPKISPKPPKADPDYTRTSFY